MDEKGLARTGKDASGVSRQWRIVKARIGEDGSVADGHGRHGKVWMGRSTTDAGRSGLVGIVLARRVRSGQAMTGEFTTREGR